MTARPIIAYICLAILAVIIAGCVTSTTTGTTGGTATGTRESLTLQSVTGDTSRLVRDPSYRIPTYPFANAYLTVEGTPGNEIWPNNGQMRIYAFGWGGDRPLAVPQVADTVGDPLIIPDGTPTLNVQKQIDLFSPLLQDLFEQKTPIPMMIFTIERQTAEATTYNLFDVQVASIRAVGPQGGTIPASEEIIFVFTRFERE